MISPGGEPACRQAGLVDTQVLSMYYVYAIKSLSRNYIYVGMTNDIERRIAEYNKGENRSTKAYRPFVLFFSEKFESRSEARKREIYLKSGVGKEFLRSISK